MPGYSIEAFLAEKAETLVAGFPGAIRPRLKDFHDIRALTTHVRLQGPVVLASFRATFERRETPYDSEVLDQMFTDLPGDPVMEREWAHFKRRAGVRDGGQTLQATIAHVAAFVRPVLEALGQDEDLDQVWIPGEGWRSRSLRPGS